MIVRGTLCKAWHPEHLKSGLVRTPCILLHSLHPAQVNQNQACTHLISICRQEYLQLVSKCVWPAEKAQMRHMLYRSSTAGIGACYDQCVRERESRAQGTRERDRLRASVRESEWQGERKGVSQRASEQERAVARACDEGSEGGREIKSALTFLPSQVAQGGLRSETVPGTNRRRMPSKSLRC